MFIVDQRFALRWVQENVGPDLFIVGDCRLIAFWYHKISKFGGDPTQVTIWGQSAGGGSVMQHIIAEDGQTNPKLFKAGISSSTYMAGQYEYNDDVPKNLYNEVVSQTNCSSSSDSLACLRAADTTSLASANVNINLAGFSGTFSIVPVLDGTYITQSPTAALKQGKLNGEALLVVGNTNEGFIFVNQTAPANLTQYVRDLFPKFGSGEVDAVVQQYKGLGTELDQVNAVMNEALFLCPMYLITEAFKDRAWKGHFAIPPSLHGDDLNYYFPTSPLFGFPTNFNNSDFQKAFSESFLSFVVHQDPNVKLDPTSILPQWNKFSDGQNEMVFNRTNDAPDLHSATADQALLERCKFWESVATLTGQ
ncbi:hypothetical protein V5O48_016909 [Marasmius crinis-equi]|uniref:Carboxylic ester hydrolase n=1 Tax=Marasmius crinis-equi TaxID=585013 RepID=A0ABR3EQF8_9AGAR